EYQRGAGVDQLVLTDPAVIASRATLADNQEVRDKAQQRLHELREIAEARADFEQKQQLLAAAVEDAREQYLGSVVDQAVLEDPAVEGRSNWRDVYDERVGQADRRLDGLRDRLRRIEARDLRAQIAEAERDIDAKRADFDARQALLARTVGEATTGYQRGRSVTWLAQN